MASQAGLKTLPRRSAELRAGEDGGWLGPGFWLPPWPARPLGVSCYQWALKTTPTGLVLAIVSTTPLVIMPFSTIMEGEKFTRRSICGGVLAVAGAIVLVTVTGKTGK